MATKIVNPSNLSDGDVPIIVQARKLRELQAYAETHPDALLMDGLQHIDVHILATHCWCGPEVVKVPDPNEGEFID